MRFGHRYRTRPFEQALQEVFKDEFLFGGAHDESNSYFTRVAVTSTTDTGEKPVILPNYNRGMENQGKVLLLFVRMKVKTVTASYTLVRPDNPKHELKLWEA